jgi:hypothetical protein
MLLGRVLVGLLAASKARAGQPALATPVTGDWLSSHNLSDPEQLNPLTSDDAGAEEDILWRWPRAARY